MSWGCNPPTPLLMINNQTRLEIAISNNFVIFLQSWYVLAQIHTPYPYRYSQ